MTSTIVVLDPIVLKVLDGVQRGVEVTLSDGMYVFGSGLDDDIHFIDVSLRAAHGRIRITASKVEIATLAGTLSTSTDGAMEPNGEWRTLEPLEIVTAGTLRFALAPRSANWATVAADDVKQAEGASVVRVEQNEKLSPWRRDRLKVMAIPALTLFFVVGLVVWSLIFGGLHGGAGSHDSRSDLEIVRGTLDSFDFGRPITTRQEVDGVIYASGYVESAVERRALSSALEKTAIPVRLRLNVLSSMRNEINQLIAVEKLKVTFELNRDGVVVLNGLILDQTTADTFADRLKDQVLGIASVTSFIRTGNSLLLDVRKLAETTQVKPFLLFRADRDLIEVSGAIPSYKLDSWVGFLQGYQRRFADDIGLRSFVQLQTPDGRLVPAGDGGITLGKSSRSDRDKALDPRRLAAGNVAIGDVLVESGRGANRADPSLQASQSGALDTANGPTSPSTAPDVGAAETGSGQGTAPSPDQAATGSTAPEAAFRRQADLARNEAASCGRAPEGTSRETADMATGEGGRCDRNRMDSSVRKPGPSTSEPANGQGRNATSRQNGDPSNPEFASGQGQDAASRPKPDTTKTESASGSDIEAGSRKKADVSNDEPVGGRSLDAVSALKGDVSRDASGGEKGSAVTSTSQTGAGISPDKEAAANKAIDRKPDFLHPLRSLEQSEVVGLAEKARDLLQAIENGNLSYAQRQLPAFKAFFALATNGSNDTGAVPQWYLPLEHRGDMDEAAGPCWAGTDLRPDDMLPALFWLDLMSASDTFLLSGFSKNQKLLLIEVALNPKSVVACAKRSPRAAQAAARSLYIKEINRNPGFVRFILRSLPAFNMDIAGASVAHERFVLTKGGLKLFEGAAPSIDSRLAVVGELGLAIQTAGGFSTVVYGPDIDWQISER